MSTPTLDVGPSAAPKAGPDASSVPRSSKRYVYCIVDGDTPEPLGAVGLSPSGGKDESEGAEVPAAVRRPGHAAPAEVFPVTYDGLSAVVSSTSCDRYEVNRDNLLTHQRVMEAMMDRGHTVLPVRFNTIAESGADRSAEQRIIQRVLDGRGEELGRLLEAMSRRVELGVKALWTEMDAVFADLVRADDRIRSLRRQMLAEQKTRRRAPAGGAAKLGEMVKNALEARKAALRDGLIGELSDQVEEVRQNAVFGDAMFANLALLVDRDSQDEVTAAMSAFESQQDPSVRIRFVGPVPPSNFVEIVIRWEY